MIHKVRNPFYCRRNQFAADGYPGQVLVIGIAASALKGETFRFCIGKNPKVYEARVDDIKAVGQAWINKKGKTVIIIPVECFKIIYKKPLTT